MKEQPRDIPQASDGKIDRSQPSSSQEERKAFHDFAANPTLYSTPETQRRELNTTPQPENHKANPPQDTNNTSVLDAIGRYIHENRKYFLELAQKYHKSTKEVTDTFQQYIQSQHGSKDSEFWLHRGTLRVRGLGGTGHAPTIEQIDPMARKIREEILAATGYLITEEEAWYRAHAALQPSDSVG